MNRMISLLLSFYIVLLTLAPCVDNDNDAVQPGHVTISTTHSPSDEIQHDGCSPFCSCTCCSISSEILANYMELKDHSLPRFIPFNFTYTFLSSYRFSIWEPPKA